MSDQLLDHCAQLFEEVSGATKALDAAADTLEAQIAALRAPVPRGEPRPDPALLDERERQLRAAAERKAQPLYESAAKGLAALNEKAPAFGKEAVVTRMPLSTAEQQRVDRFDRAPVAELDAVLREAVALERAPLLYAVRREALARAAAAGASDADKALAKKTNDAFAAFPVPEAERAAPLFQQAHMLTNTLLLKFVRTMRPLDPIEKLTAYRRGQQVA